MNEIQILTTYNPFVVTGTVLSIVWALAYVLSWVVQLSWAWVDEAKVGKDNWVAKRLELPSKIKDGWYRNTGDYYHYSYLYFKDGIVKDTAATGYGLTNLSDYGTEDIDVKNLPRLKYRGRKNYKNYIFGLPLIWFAMLCLNFWWISMWFAMFFAVAFTMRMARRGQKILTAHINDKDAHKE